MGKKLLEVLKWIKDAWGILTALGLTGGAVLGTSVTRLRSCSNAQTGRRSTVRAANVGEAAQQPWRCVCARRRAQGSSLLYRQLVPARSTEPGVDTGS